jgi:hypothetical protein
MSIIAALPRDPADHPGVFQTIAIARSRRKLIRDKRNPVWR